MVGLIFRAVVVALLHEAMKAALAKIAGKKPEELTGDVEISEERLLEVEASPNLRKGLRILQREVSMIEAGLEPERPKTKSKTKFVEPVAPVVAPGT